LKLQAPCWGASKINIILISEGVEEESDASSQHNQLSGLAVEEGPEFFP
jgi:hypothetical protein